TRALLNAGMPIDDINTVRKHLSQLKGGQLARLFYPARLEVLVFSDSIGDHLHTIGSGPLAPDPTTFADALAIIDRHHLRPDLPGAVIDHLEAGHRGDYPETVKPDDPALISVHHAVVASRRDAAAAATRAASRRCWDAHTVNVNVQGSARDIGPWLVEQGLQYPPGTCLVFAGETTVHVQGNGLGGRNQETALAAAIALADRSVNTPKLTIASIATDGVDGPTTAAGAVVDGHTLERAREMGLDPQDFLDRNDSHTFFSQLGDLIVTGPTRTNVNDVMVVLVE
ncbi:MAG: MOFRL family protein, partial [Myxococcota bacterium]